MLSRLACARRRGLTLVEVTVAVALLGVVLALVSHIGAGVRRQLGLAAARGAALEQLRDAAAILPLDLRALSSAGGDIPPGGASDSMIEAQVTMASGVLCNGGGTHAVIALATRADGSMRRGVPAAGDTLWLLAETDSAERWVPVAARSVQPSSTRCALATAAGTPALLDTARALDVGLQVVFGDSVGVPVSSRDSSLAQMGVGTSVRITRPLRYRVYRGPDGGSYLGLQEWSASLGRYATVQPVSGPYEPAIADSTAMPRFRYFDSTGALLPRGITDTRRIARIEIAFRSSGERSASRGAGQVDSLRAVVALRNRQP